MPLQGVDVVAFTAGIGENSYGVRSRVCPYLAWLGAEVDDEKLKQRGEEMIVSRPGDRLTVMIVPTNEELMIARQTLELLA